ncbi:hypothetical protein AALB16_05175 [Lachnospiraceae bacterium 62-35]
MGNKKVKKVSYIRKPLARHSPPALVLSAVSFLFTSAGVWIAVNSQGNAGLNAAALGLCGILTGLTGLLYCWRSFVEKEKNYILARIALVCNSLVLLFWACMAIAGMMR